MAKFICSYIPTYVHWLLPNVIHFLACGSLSRLSYGVLWPITKLKNTAKIFCSDINPLFGFGPYATRYCREDATWSTVDTSQCSIMPVQKFTIVVYSIYVEEDNINNEFVTSAEIEQVSM